MEEEKIVDEFALVDGKPTIVVDDRELKTKTSLKLFELGALMHSKRLLVGDFVCSNRVCVERKLAEDFESSIIDGRLFAQADELRKNFESPLICVVGKNFERINKNALQGAFISLATDYRIPLLFFDSEDQLAEFLFACAKREQDNDRTPLRLRVGKPVESLSVRQRFIVESLPGVGHKNAINLLKEFHSVQGVFEADEEDLCKASGIGKEKARQIRKVIEEKFKEE